MPYFSGRNIYIFKNEKHGFSYKTDEKFVQYI